MAVTRLRSVVALISIGVLALVVGCSGAKDTSSVPTAGPKVVVPPAANQPAQLPIAQVKSVTPAKAVSPNPAGGPRLSIDVEAVDYGNVPFGNVVAYSFNVKNVGSAPVNLGPPYIRVKEGC